MAAAKSLYHAVQGADPAAIQQVLYAANDSEKQLCRHFADLLVAGRKLEEAVRGKFAQGGGNFALPMITQSDLAKYDQGLLQPHGDDEAELTLSGQAHPLKFKRIGGQWKVVVSDYAGAAPANLPQQLQTLGQFTTCFAGSGGGCEFRKICHPRGSRGRHPAKTLRRHHRCRAEIAALPRKSEIVSRSVIHI